MVKITSETDPLLLKTTAINSVVYEQLKASQDLIVDFESFPRHLIELIHSSAGNANNARYGN